MTRRSWILIGIVLVAFILIFTFVYRYSNKRTNPLSLVPQHAAMVWHIAKFPEKLEKFRNDNLWKNLKSNHSYFHDLDKRMKLMDLLLSKDSLRRTYPQKIITSFHCTGTDQFDVLFFVPVEKEIERESFTSIIEEIKEEGKYRIEKRIFNDYEIYEIIEAKERSGFSYIFYNDIIVGSFTGFLIEDVIRVIEDEARPFRNKINTAAESGEALIQVNYAQLPKFLGLFAKKEYRAALDGLTLFADYSVGDGHYNKEQVLFSGYTYGNKYSYLNCFQGQVASKSWIRKYLSTNVGLLYYFGFNNGKQLNQSLEQYWQLNNDTLQLKKRSKLVSVSPSFVKSFSELLGKELVLAYLETSDPDKTDKAIYIHSYKPKDLLDELTFFAEKHGGKKKVLYKEQYKKYILRELPVSDFPEKMWGSAFKGFDHCFYAMVDHYIVLASSLPGLKFLLTDIDNENVWQRSVTLNSYLEEALSESNVSLLINTKRSISGISNCMGATYRDSFLKYTAFWSSIPFLAFQFNSSNDRFYTNFIFRHELKGAVALKESDKSERLVKEVMLPYKISGSAVLFHNVKKSTILVKDSLAVYLFSQDGWIQWKDSVKTLLTGKTYSGDLNKDGTADYIFASREKLYAVSGKDGRNLPGFPVLPPKGSAIHTLSLVDYDNNRNYRIITSDHLGNIYMYDAKGKNLEGWNPRKLARKFVSEPRHVRVLGKDMIIAVQEDGKVNVLNRRGGLYPGFPVKVPESLVPDYFVKVGSDFTSSFIIVLTRSGQLFRINLKGEIKDKTQIYRPASEVEFSLVTDQKKASFVLVRQALGKTEILDEEEKTVLEREGAYNSKEVVSYYNYGAHHQYFIITDLKNAKSIVYNGLGKQLTKKPVESTYPPAVKENEPKDKFLLFSVNNRKFSVKGYR